MSAAITNKIFKAQRPLFTNAPDGGGFLVYDKERDYSAILPLGHSVGNWFPKDVYKIYVYGKIVGGEFVVLSHAPKQVW